MSELLISIRSENSSANTVCPVCRCKVDDEKKIVLPLCGHLFCEECFTFFFQHTLKTSDPFSCCLCSQLVDLKWVEELKLTSKDAIDCYIARRRRQTEIECPQCKQYSPLLAKSDAVTTNDQNFYWRTCVECRHEFCQIHGNKHTRHEVCVEEKLDAKTMESLGVKACPNIQCQGLVNKNEGCNAMTCHYCKTAFCWVCGAELGSISSYTHLMSGDCGIYGDEKLTWVGKISRSTFLVFVFLPATVILFCLWLASLPVLCLMFCLRGVTRTRTCLLSTLQSTWIGLMITLCVLYGILFCPLTCLGLCWCMRTRIRARRQVRIIRELRQEDGIHPFVA